MRTERLEDSLFKRQLNEGKKKAKQKKKRPPKAMIDKTTRKMRDIIFAKKFFDELAKLPEDLGINKLPRPGKEPPTHSSPQAVSEVYSSIREQRGGIFMLLCALIWLFLEVNSYYWDGSRYKVRRLYTLEDFIHAILTDAPIKGYLEHAERFSVLAWMWHSHNLLPILHTMGFSKVFSKILKRHQSISPFARQYLRSILLTIVEDDTIAFNLIQDNAISSLLNAMKSQKISPRYEEAELEPTLIRTLLNSEERMLAFVNRGRKFRTELEYAISLADRYPLTLSILLADLTSYDSVQAKFTDYDLDIILDASMVLKHVKDDHVTEFAQLALDNLSHLEPKPINAIHSFNFEWQKMPVYLYAALPVYLWIRFRWYGSWKGLSGLSVGGQKAVLSSSVIRSTLFGGLSLSVWSNLKEHKEFIHTYIQKILDSPDFTWKQKVVIPMVSSFEQPDNIFPSAYGYSSVFIRGVLTYLAPLTLAPQIASFGIMYGYSRLKTRAMLARKNVSNRL